MRLITIALAGMIIVGCSDRGQLPAGSVYRAVDRGVELTVREDGKVEYGNAERRLLGAYSIEEDGRVRVVVDHLGSQQVFYFEHDPKIGLTGEDGTLYYNAEQAEGRVNHAEAQLETMKILRNVGTAMMAWLTDNVGAAAAGHAVDEWPLRTPDEVRDVLVPAYLSELPLQDGRGHDLEYRLDIDDPLASKVMLVRSPGSDGEFESSYSSAPFDPDETWRDIVWADGYYISWPERQ
jgi:hypothetical protein